MEKPKTSQLQAREWLIRNDPEAAEFWESLPEDSDFIDAVRQNHRDFGPEQPLAIPGHRYRKPVGPSSPTIVVDALAHSLRHENSELVVYHFLRDEVHGGPDTALRYYMSVDEFENGYMEVTR